MKLDCVWKYGQYQGSPNNMKSGFLKRKKGTIRGPETSCLGCNLCLIGKWQKGCQSPGSLHLMGGCCRAGEQVTMPLVMERATSLGEELYSVCYNPETHQSDQSHTCQRGQVTWERPAYKCFGFFLFFNFDTYFAFPA